MTPAPLRSILFNICFYAITLIACIALLPTLILPRTAFMWVVYSWVTFIYLCEKYILGLDYEIRGQEHLPKIGSYIIAAKHQSPYETFKLHILFGDPAIILKQELLKIPLWGWYLKKSDVIAIDRSSPDKARESIANGARHVMEQNRPIVIFPQGTRVLPGTSSKEKPYKTGITRLQEDTGLPIIPLAMNSGCFWQKGKWNKYSGKVIFQFMPPIDPGLPKDQLMKTLEANIENTSNLLIEEAKSQKSKPTIKSYILLLLGLALYICYGFFWNYAAKEVTKAYLEAEINNTERLVTLPKISGFPGPIKIFVEQELLTSPQGSVQIQNLELSGWPVPNPFITLKTGGIVVKSYKWPKPLGFQSLNAKFQYTNDLLDIERATLGGWDYNIHVTGLVDFNQKPVPLFNTQVEIENHLSLLNQLVEATIIDQEKSIFIGFGLTALMQNGVVRAQIRQKDNKLFVGPLPILEIPVN